MKKFIFVLPVVVLAALTSTAGASLVDYVVADDHDSVVSCTSTWAGTSQTLTIDGVQNYLRPGHVLSDVDHFTASSAEDPTITVNNNIDNDTGITWTGYTIKVGIRAKNAATPLSALSLVTGANTPSDWTATVVEPLTYYPTYTDFDGRILTGYYIGTIQYTAGTPVPDGGAVSLPYTASFKGATSYVSWQELTPVPEPATLILLAGGGLIALARKRRNARKA